MNNPLDIEAFSTPESAAALEKLRLWMEATGSLYFETAPDGSIDEPSAHFERLSGMSWPAYRGWGWLETVHPEDRAQVLARWQEAVANQTIYCCEQRLWHQQEQAYRWHLCRAVPTLDDQGEICRWIAAAIDVQGHKEAERTLRDSERGLRNLFDSMAEGFALCRLMYDASGQPCDFCFEKINPAFTAITGWTEQQVLGQSQRSLNPELEQFWVDQFARACRGETVHLEGYARGIDMHFECWAFPAGDDEFALFFLDIGERKRAEQAVRRSEARFRQMANAAPGIVWTTDASAMTTYINDRWLAYTGLTRQQSLGRGWEEHVHEDDLSHVRQAWHQALDSSSRFETEVRLRRYDGIYRWFLARAVPVVDEQGQVNEWVGTAIDITERREAEQARRQSELRFRELANVAPVFVWTTDPHVRATFLNDQWYRYTGLTEAQSLGEGWQSVVHAEDLPRVVDIWDAAMAQPELVEFELRVRRFDGVYRWYFVRAVPVFDDAGEVSEWIGTSTDVHEQKTAADQLAAMNETLEQRVAERTAEREAAQRLAQEREQEVRRMDRIGLMSELASGIGHELNQPLAAINTYAQGCLLRLANLEASSERDAGLCEGLQHIVEEASRSGRIINRLRDLTRMGEPAWSVVRIEELLSDVVELVRAKAISADIELNMEVAQSLPPIVVGRVELQQVLLNLLNNAIQAIESRETPGPRRVELLAQARDTKTLQITVRDTGPGASDEQIAQMFDPFFTTKDTGTGMGLNICETIIHHHEGKIWAERNTGGGLSVHIRLPLDNAER
jgi:PAS domain S-box-containing protein